jgi:predicted nuclease with TOPRIM domain
MGFFKTIVRVGVVTALVAGAAALIAGPHRVAALFESMRNSVNEKVDSAIDDPTALRAQLRDLEAQYPERISSLRGDLAELQEQQRQVERDRAVAERVVQLADSDAGTLQPLVAQAQAASAEAQPGTLVTVRFEDSSLKLDEATSRLSRIVQTRTAYASRSADAARDLECLGQQRERLEQLLAQLESERSDFRAQIWQMDRQVDTIARNDHLIELMQRRQKTMDECGRYEAGSLAQVQSAMAEVKSKQESQLKLLTNDQERLDYEDVARMQVDAAPAAKPDKPVQVVEIGGATKPAVVGAANAAATTADGPRVR